MQPRQLGPVAEPQSIFSAQNDFVADLEILRQDVEHPRWYAGLDVQERDGAAPQLPQAPVDAFEQVVRFVLLDLQVRVADDAEKICALDLCPGAVSYTHLT